MDNSFMYTLMDRLDFPIEAIEYFSHLEEKVCYFKEKFDLLIKSYNKKIIELSDVLDDLNVIAEKADVHKYSIHMYFLLNCTQHLYRQYKLAGVAENIYWDTVADLKYKLLECYNAKGIWGTFVAQYCDRVFNMSLFALGRFQYEHIPFEFDKYEKNGYAVKKDDIVYNIHIPSSGPIGDEVRYESYKCAYKFYQQELKDNPLVIVCASWLLYPEHYNFLHHSSNIVKFMNDFDIFSYVEREVFDDGWRIFGKDYNENPLNMPTDTSLKKAYAKRLSEHKKTGIGFGILLFDGEKIIR